jgi:pyruvate/2-oxoglutarate/acetoin dehydrogenase E1 component
MTVAETIRETTRKHLMGNNGVLLAQCVKAVGWIGGTVPEIYDDDKIIELPTSDVSNGGIVVGFGLANRRPIYVIRYAPFLHYNAASLVNYACKSKEMWNVSCPIFVRCLVMEGGIGPVASGAYLSPIMRMPGTVLFAPMSINEWKEAWEYFMAHDVPVFCSEHRNSFAIDYEMEDIIRPDAKITIFAISNARINAMKIAQELPCNVIHIYKLKPFHPKAKEIKALMDSGKGIVIDTEHEICGGSQSIAYELMHMARVPVYAMGLEDKTAGFAPHCDNLTPSVEKIKKAIQDILG